MRRLGWLALCALVTVSLLAVVGCRGQSAASGGVAIDLDIIPAGAAVGQPATVSVTVADATGAPVQGARVEVEGNMSHAGMTPVLVQAPEVSPGKYVASDFAFTMGGDWVITARATLADGGKAEKSVDVKGVAGAMRMK